MPNIRILAQAVGSQVIVLTTFLWLGWLVGCFGFNGPLRQYFSLYRAISQREGGRRERIDESKNVQTTPTRTYCKRNKPLPYCNQNCRTPRHWKFTQHRRTTRPPLFLWPSRKRGITLPYKGRPKKIHVRSFFVLMLYIKFQVPSSIGSLVLQPTKGVTDRRTDRRTGLN